MINGSKPNTEAGLLTTGVPECGQLVEVRRRQFIVSDVIRSTVSSDPLKPLEHPQHLVRLTSVEEDAIGEELEVIWELEPGARTHENLLLPKPEGFDDPERLDT